MSGTSGVGRVLLVAVGVAATLQYAAQRDGWWGVLAVFGGVSLLCGLGAIALEYALARIERACEQQSGVITIAGGHHNFSEGDRARVSSRV